MSNALRAREVDSLVQEVVRHMVEGTWSSDVCRQMAEREGVTFSAAQAWAKDAGRLLRMGPDVELYRGQNLRRLDSLATQSEDPRAAVAAVAEQNRMLGLHAPQRHEVAVVVAQYDALPKPQKAQWLRDKAAALLAEADRLDAGE